MSEVQVDQKTYQMPPVDGFTVAHFLTVADVERSLRFYETVFGGRILSRGDSSGAPGYIQIANTWLSEVEEPSLSQSQRTNTARRAATFAILMAILSKLGRAIRALPTAKQQDA